MKTLNCLIVSLFIATVGTSSHAQTTPQPDAGKKLEDLLLCKPSNKFTRKAAERAFKDLGLVKQKDERYTPAKGQKVAIFGGTVLDAAISDESDEASLSVRVTDRTAAELAQQLGIKKRRVNGPSGPEMEYSKVTGKGLIFSLSPYPSISPHTTSIECVAY